MTVILGVDGLIFPLIGGWFEQLLAGMVFCCFGMILDWLNIERDILRVAHLQARFLNFLVSCLGNKYSWSCRLFLSRRS